MVREYSKHYRDSSLVNDHQSNLDICDDPCSFTKDFYRWTTNADVLVSAIHAISETWSPVSPYLVQSHYRHCHLLVLWYSIPVTLSHVATLDGISLSGPRVSFHHAEEQIPLLMHTPQHTPLETQRHIFSHPVKVETVDDKGIDNRAR
jgi:hypothetical protein